MVPYRCYHLRAKWRNCGLLTRLWEHKATSRGDTIRIRLKFFGLRAKIQSWTCEQWCFSSAEFKLFYLSPRGNCSCRVPNNTIQKKVWKLEHTQTYCASIAGQEVCKSLPIPRLIPDQSWPTKFFSVIAVLLSELSKHCKISAWQLLIKHVAFLEF